MLIAAFIWGIAFVAQKQATVVPPITVGAVRSLIAAIFLFMIIPLMDKLTKNGRKFISKRGIDLTKKEIIGGCLCGTFLFFATFLQQLGMTMGTDAGKSSFITSLYVIVVPIIGLFINRRPTLRLWISVALAVVGFYFLCMDITEGFTLMVSDLFVLAGVFIFALQIITIDRYTNDSDGVRLSFMQFVSSALIGIVSMLIFEQPIDFTTLGEQMLPMLYLGVMSSGIAYTLQIIGQKGTHPALASVILSLESIFGALFASILLEEKMSGPEYFGCAIVFIAIILAQIDVKELIKNLIRYSKK
jgi:drug/metabolite transporter (DMT)-like permease